MSTKTESPHEGAFYDALETAHRHLETVRRQVPHREGGRAFSVVRTKLDEARLWMGEALALADEPETAASDRP